MSNKHTSGEVWMVLTDRQKLARLMAIAGISQRELARRVWGSKSHSYVARLVNGTARTVTPEAAVRMTLVLQCGVDDLFLGRADSIPSAPDRTSEAA
jgi:transcriptional regulator with XRE-family HTH domain